MKNPFVSIVCVCYNQAPYVGEAIRSVLNQTYENTQLIVVDDGSTDGSQEEIREAIHGTSSIFLSIEKSVGNCKAFNRGFNTSMGDFIIDLAADDVLRNDRVDKGLKTFAGRRIGVEFCNVMNVDSDGNALESHFKPFDQVPQGDLYKLLIEHFIISAPGMMIKREVLETLGGYDETLSYEDFDFWIRSSRLYQYGYTNQVLVNKRQLRNSYGKEQFKFRNTQQKSTLRVCQKANTLNASAEEAAALRRRCNYEIKQCIRYGNLELIPAYIKLWLTAQS